MNRAAIWNLAKKGLFRMDAEAAHRFSVSMVQLVQKIEPFPGHPLLRLISGTSSLKTSKAAQIFGINFQSRLGLAAGFDKNAEILSALPAFGFGFAEIGTVTPRAQKGNPMPRLFRDPSRMALFNRMGFNNLGSALVAGQLRKAKPGLPENFRVGVNIGKNKDTPLEKAVEDYVQAASDFENLADYLVINVSSPNTPGLRSLQTVEGLKPIVEALKKLLSEWKMRPPLLLKLAPEVPSSELLLMIQHLEPLGIEGWVLSNTLAGKWDPLNLEGGWSGGVLTQLSSDRLAEARALTSKPIISVGGITSVEEAVRRISLGADLIQVYTGWIYRGPSFPGEVVRSL